MIHTADVLASFVLGTIAFGTAVHAAPQGGFDLTTRLYAPTTDDGLRGEAVSVKGGPPWEVDGLVETEGGRSIRNFEKYLYVIEELAGKIRRVKLDGSARQVYDFGAGSEPQDILVVAQNTAYVTRKGSTWLHLLDLRTGYGIDVVDLGILAGEEQTASLRTMIRDGKLLFIQVQLRNPQESAVPGGDGGVLAVFDLSSGTLIDVEPYTFGVQGVALLGAPPRLRMQIVDRTLFVSTSDERLDNRGGIEMVNLDRLQSFGYALSEDDVGADLGGFVMTSDEGGYFVFHTDIVPSTHLKPFTIAGGPPPGPEIIFMLGDFVDNMAYDPATKRLFLPSGYSTFGLTPGIYVIDTANDVVYDDPIDTGMKPHDVVIAD